MAALRIREDYRTLTGPEKAAIMMLALGEEHATKLFTHMDDEEIRELSQTMANLGTVSSTIIERLFDRTMLPCCQVASALAATESTRASVSRSARRMWTEPRFGSSRVPAS